MFWTPEKHCLNDPFENEPQLEAATLEVSEALFGPNRIYLNVKKLIGAKGKTKNIPDGYHANTNVAHFAEYRRIIAAANSSYAG